MSKSPKTVYNGTKRPSLLMVESLVTEKAATAQLKKIDLRGTYLVDRHTELAKLASSTEEVKTLRKNRNEDVEILDELELLKLAKSGTARRVEELKPVEEEGFEYDYPSVEW